MLEAQVVRTISSRDEMLAGHGRRYFDLGREAVAEIRRVLDFQPATILDLPCGHGRVLRWLRAQYPKAHITACDLNRDGVDFCAQTFGAVPVYGSENPQEVPLGSYDLIWCGSLFTHLEHWDDFLSVFRAHLRGVLVFTTNGARVREVPYANFSDPDHVKVMQHGYDETGFGYVNYPGSKSYGLSVSHPDWVKDQLAGFELVSFREGAWGGRQDVIAVKPAT
jgi:SAM-dependent methyltransferase